MLHSFFISKYRLCFRGNEGLVQKPCPVLNVNQNFGLITIHFSISQQAPTQMVSLTIMVVESFALILLHLNKTMAINYALSTSISERRLEAKLIKPSKDKAALILYQENEGCQRLSYAYDPTFNFSQTCVRNAGYPGILYTKFPVPNCAEQFVEYCTYVALVLEQPEDWFSIESDLRIFFQPQLEMDSPSYEKEIRSFTDSLFTRPENVLLSSSEVACLGFLLSYNSTYCATLPPISK